MSRQLSTWIGLLILLMALVIFASQFKLRNVVLLGLLSYGWPETEAEIFHSNMENITQQSVIDSAPDKRPQVVYRFTVDNQQYEGYNIRFARGLFPEYWIPEDMNQYKKGNRIKVYYNPNNPNESVIIRGFKPIIGLAEITMLLIAVTTMGLLIFFKFYSAFTQKRLDQVMVDRSRREMIQRQQHQMEQQQMGIPDEVMIGVWRSPDGLIELKSDKTWAAETGENMVKGTWYLDDRELGILVTEGEGRNDPLVGIKTIFKVIDHDQELLVLATQRQMKLGREIATGSKNTERWTRSGKESLGLKDQLS